MSLEGLVGMGVLYLAIKFGGEAFMKNRKPLNTKFYAMVSNAILTVGMPMMLKLAVRLPGAPIVHCSFAGARGHACRPERSRICTQRAPAMGYPLCVAAMLLRPKRVVQSRWRDTRWLP